MKCEAGAGGALGAQTGAGTGMLIASEYQKDRNERNGRKTDFA
jgi:hypothetical protein